MKFIQLNGKKVLLVFLINLLVCSTVGWTWYGIENHDRVLGDPLQTPMLVYGFGLLFFLTSYFSGWNTLRVSRKIFRYISTLDFLDSNDCFIAYLHKESSILYTQECFCCTIEGFPVIISLTLGRGSTLNFEVITTKFNRTSSEFLSVRLDWLLGYKQTDDVKKEVYSFIGNLRSKPSKTACFDAMIADKRISPVNGGYNAGI